MIDKSEQISILIDAAAKAAGEDRPDAAMKLAQAATNAANAMSIVNHDRLRADPLR